MKKQFYTLTIIILLSSNTNGQLPSFSVGENFNSRTLSELIDYIEARSDLKFFYLRKWTDSTRVKQDSVPSLLEPILKKTLANTSLSYYYDSDGKIILSFDYRIEPKLTSFFSNINLQDSGKKNDYSDNSYLRKEQVISILPGQGELIVIGSAGIKTKGQKVALSGIVKEKETGEPIIGATLFLSDLSTGTATDKYGYYVVSVPTGSHSLKLKYMGRKDKEFRIMINGNGTLDIEMEERILELRGVVITADKEQNIKGLQLGFEKLDIQSIKQVSSNMGEGDLLKTALLLPGVQTVGEGASGINVRGGSTDQNLILLDGAPVFNSSHLFGFFSVFNPDIVKDFKLYKSSIPAQYGGRLASVLDVTVKTGNLKKLSVNGGISPIATRLSFEGPIVKDKASVLIGYRSSYSDWLLSRTDISSLNNSSAGFLDLNIKADYIIDEKNQITLSGYYSEDHFKLHSDTLYKYNCLSGNISLKHSFSKKIYGLFSLIYSDYNYSVSSKKRTLYAFDLDHHVNYLEGKADFTWFLNSYHKITSGANIIRYKIDPGNFNPVGLESLISARRLLTEKAIETGIHISDEYIISDILSINFGLRYSGFFTLGPSMLYKYREDAPRSVQNRIDSVYYQGNKISGSKGGPELRLSGRLRTGANSSIKISYTKMYQYLQMISNTTAISPTDTWKISGPYLPVQNSRQFSSGFYMDLLSGMIESSFEVYYKTSKGILEYRGGTQLVMNPNLEVDLLNGTGKAYGFELQLKKKYGALNGWMSYTYSRSLIKVDSRYEIDQINHGQYFPSNFDKPHDFALVLNYRFSRIHSISSTITYSTGRPITYPVAKYQFRDREFLQFSNRNEYRIPDYFRMDLSLNLEGKLRVSKLWHNSLSISIYNITGRDNAYSIFFISDESRNVKGYKLSVFSQPIFSVTYNFNF
jgi:hypothetical protein